MSIASYLNDAIVSIGDFICGYPLFILLIGGGLFLFIYSGALPIRKLGTALQSLHVQKSGEGQISSFQALMSTISSTVGLGNIAGVAIALVVGALVQSFGCGLVLSLAWLLSSLKVRWPSCTKDGMTKVRYKADTKKNMACK